MKKIQLSKCDVLTVLTSSNNVNKSVTIDPQGNPKKESSAAISYATAKECRVKDVRHLKKLISKCARNPKRSLMLATVQSSLPDSEDLLSYQIRSKKKLMEITGAERDEGTRNGLTKFQEKSYAARLKSNFRHSQWIVLDYDYDPEAPQELQFDHPKDWVTQMSRVIPGFEEAGYLIVSSASSRAQYKGKPAFGKGGWHCYVRVEDQLDIPRFASDLKMAMKAEGMNYIAERRSKKSGEKRGEVERFIIDFAVYSPERIIFEANPTVEGEGLSVRDPKFIVHEGGLLDTSKVVMSDDQKRLYEESTGNQVGYRAKKGVKHAISVDTCSLQLDTELELKNGTSCSVEELFEGWVDSPSQQSHKVRVQAPFRDSKSWNAYITYRDGQCFVYDNGNQTKYVLSADKIDNLYHKLIGLWLRDADTDKVTIKSEWLTKIRPLVDSPNRTSIMEDIARMGDIKISDMKVALNKAEKGWAIEILESQFEQDCNRFRREGREPVEWIESDSPSVLGLCVDIINKDDKSEPIYNHGGSLATILEAVPKSVKAIQQSQNINDHAVLIIKTYDAGAFKARVEQSIVFYKGRKFIGAPKDLMMMMQSYRLHDWTKPLVGIIDYPLVDADGSVLVNAGYDQSTGLYGSFPLGIDKYFLSHPTKKDAEKALRYLSNVVLEGFEFKTREDKSMAICCLLTMMQRRLMGICPAFLSRASTQQTGKTSLFQMFSAIVYGRPLPTKFYNTSEEETDKSLLSILAEGVPCFLLDNIDDGAVINNSVISLFTTSEIFQSRKLGVSQMMTYATDVVMLLTGNNVSPGKDLVSRVMTITLTSSKEIPTERSFKRNNLDKWGLDNRAKVLAKLAAILQAYRLSDEIIKVQTPSRYYEFDEMIRAPLEWLGEPDVMKLERTNLYADDSTVAERNLLKAWFKVFRNRKIKSNELVPYFENRGNIKRQDPLTTALVELMQPKGSTVPTARDIGIFLGRMKGKIVGGLVLEQKNYPSSKRSSEWYVVEFVEA